MSIVFWMFLIISTVLSFALIKIPTTYHCNFVKNRYILRNTPVGNIFRNRGKINHYILWANALSAAGNAGFTLYFVSRYTKILNGLVISCAQIVPTLSRPPDRTLLWFDGPSPLRHAVITHSDLVQWIIPNNVKNEYV